MKLDHPLQAWAKKTRGGIEFHQTILDLTLRCPELFPSPEAAAKYCEAAANNFIRRPLQPNEINNALTGAYAKQNDHPYSPKPPKLSPSPQLIQTHRGREGDLDSLRISSDLTVRTAGQALAELYDPADWICLSKAIDRPEFDSVENWIKKPDLHEYQFIVPSTYLQGCLSKAREGIQETRWLVHEIDDPNLDAEAQIGLALKLAGVLPLQMVVWSADHSLHAWFDSSQDPHAISAFQQLSAQLGGDKAMQRPTQPARLPLGTRPGKGTQELIFFKKPGTIDDMTK